MEAVCSLKRAHQPDFEECLICQERKTERLINGGERGFETLKHASQTRDKLLDTDNRPAIDRILTVPPSDINQLCWHKSCFSSFTSRTKIQRLEKKQEKSRPEISEPSTSAIKLRSSTKSVNWDLCIFCQDTKVKEILCSVTTFKMSDKILNLS